MTERGIRAAQPEPVPSPSDPERSGPDRRWIVFVVIAVVAIAGVIAVVAGRSGGAAPAAVATTGTATTEAAAVRTQPTGDPADAALLMLQDQAAALLRGDEAGWLAPVDPAAADTVAYFRKRFRMLRGLHVSQFSYARGSKPYVRDGDPEFTDTIYSGFCFSMPNCPELMPADGIPLGAPRIREKFVFKRTGDRYLIGSVVADPDDRSREPMPWQSGDLVLAEGKRVTVAAAPAVAKRAKEALAVADKAASVADRFAAQFHNPQQRYRIFLADDKSWKRWFSSSSARDKAVIGVTVAINGVQSEIMVKTSGNGSRAELADTIQHEMGHVVSLGHVNDTGKKVTLDLSEEWLTEGIAEYIGRFPQRATASPRMPAVRQLVTGSGGPRSIEVSSLDWDDPKKTAAYYGFGHLAVDCLARKFGEPKMIAFVSVLARQGRSADEASERAFGKPFDQVDKTCMSWIRAQL
ncbi:hypothetical protein GCM10010168_47440 [Actinoplanes ianthinogenes]|uniref:Uncharacterized protein n=1 Tax=Actinoplanes ianthinogenes TaxID=122358 RepID=A0ABM7LNV3_9ACTN|nr:hypothetical protein [Actinoplanes ianthinogenes]BCJ40957.1 hypothetical protein Aiant_16140 [Actinoplanes ianthinogenes]GGR23938.1 hypothetical protein GCM10010168_47440 [Actinoplanes ianthinogenes]